MGKLDGKTALITGGTSGIGLATARLFAAEGARVAITGRDPDRLKSTEAALGAECFAISAEVEKPADRTRMIETVRERFGGLDILFANAGIFRAVTIAETDEAAFDEMFAVNVKGAFFTVQKALPLLRNGASVIFNTSSMIHIGVPHTGMYVATKAGLRSLVRVLSTEYADRGIRFNTVSPGSIITPLHDAGGLPPEERARVAGAILTRTPAGRFGEADEVAKAVLFLASGDGSYVFGEELVVSGGWSAV